MKELCEETKSLGEQIKSSILHLNNLRLLCELCEEKDDKVQFSAMHEMYQVFIHLIKSKPEYVCAFRYKSVDVPSSSKKSKKEGDDQIVEFLQQKYQDFISILFSQHLHNPDSCLQVPAVKILMRFVQLENQIYLKSKKDRSGGYMSNS